MQSLYTRIYKDLRKSTLLLQAVILAGIGVAPFILQGMTSAVSVQLINREAQVTNATPNTSFDITFEFDTPVNASEDIESLEFEFVDDPLASYDSDSLSDIPTVTANYGGQSGFANATAFGSATLEVGRNATGGTATNQIDVSRTEIGAEDNNTDASITFTGLTHNSAVNTTFYVRIRAYNDASLQNDTTQVFEGVVAQSTSQTLNVSARVQERLSFCVGATDVDDATSDPGADCGAISGTNVDLGVVDDNPSISPVDADDGGNERNGIAFINTNAAAGSTVQYAALQESSSGKLKVDGTTCTNNISTIDQCFNSLNSLSTLTAEGFGMTVAGVNCGSNDDSGYTCDYSTGDTSLGPVGDYIGAGSYTAGTIGTYVTTNDATNQFIWDDTGTYNVIAQTSPAGTGTNVIDDEALILKFGARAALTTPTGLYDVDADFVATPTF